MLSPKTVFRLKVALIKGCQHEGIKIVPGTARVPQGSRKVNDARHGNGHAGARHAPQLPARRTSSRSTGTFNAPTQRKLIPPPLLTVGEKAARLMESWAAAGLDGEARGAAITSRNSRHSQRVTGSTRGTSTWRWPWCAFAGMLALKASGSRTATEGFAGKVQRALHGRHTREGGGRARTACGSCLARRSTRGLIGLLDEPGRARSSHHFIMTRGRIILGLVRTVEGNTSRPPRARASQDNGGQAWRRRVRRASTITFSGGLVIASPVTPSRSLSVLSGRAGKAAVYGQAAHDEGGGVAETTASRWAKLRSSATG